MIWGDKSPLTNGGRGDLGSDGTRECPTVVWFDLEVLRQPLEEGVLYRQSRGRHRS